MKGNEALAEGIRAGCRFFFGYPITPQNKSEYMARRMPEWAVFSASGEEVTRLIWSTGLPARWSGFNFLVQSGDQSETRAFLPAGAQVPVIVNVARGGPGLVV